jgi:hypothetical protein
MNFTWRIIPAARRFLSPLFRFDPDSDVMGMYRFCSANWDLAEVERDWKDVIVQKGGLLNKLYIPRL